MDFLYFLKDLLMDKEVIIMIIVFVIPLFFTFLMCLVFSHYRKQLKRYRNIKIGMSEREMLNIMGKGYNKSSLKGNRFKYEWRINGTSVGRNGVRSYTGVRKVDIYVKDGEVEEIRPYNVS